MKETIGNFKRNFKKFKLAKIKANLSFRFNLFGLKTRTTFFVKIRNKITVKF